MKRSPLVHERVFADERRADEYARRHKTMAERFGREYAKKLQAVAGDDPRFSRVYDEVLGKQR